MSTNKQHTLSSASWVQDIREIQAPFTSKYSEAIGCHGAELSGLDLSSPIAAPLIDAFRSPPPWSGTTTRLPSVDDLQSAVFLHVAGHILRTVTKPDTSH